MSYEVLFVLRVIDKHGDIFPMFLRRAMPMVPQSKMHMRVVVNDDFHQVDSIYWSPDEGFVVYFVFDSTPLAAANKAGWSTERKIYERIS